jgi:hypothetical protein
MAARERISLPGEVEFCWHGSQAKDGILDESGKTDEARSQFMADRTERDFEWWFDMTCRRGRVAVTLPTQPHPQDRAMMGLAQMFIFKTPRPRIHVGHARTLLLGELHCRREGIPFHVRIDCGWEAVQIRDPGWVDLLGCLSWFGIATDHVYQCRLGPRPDEFYAKIVGSQAWGRFLEVRDQYTEVDMDHWPSMADDIEHFPSLMIRGQEFETPDAGAPEWPPEANSTPTFRKLVAVEKAYYQALGIERRQLTLPLITDEAGVKMSKSLAGIGWDCLQAASADEARAYLLATAANPLDPLAAIGQPVDTHDLDPTPHVWSWKSWGSFIRQA